MSTVAKFSASSNPPVNEHPSETLKTIITYYQRERMWIKHTQDVIAFARRNQLKNIPALDIQTPVTVDKHITIPIWKRRKTKYRLHLNDLSPVKLSHRLLAHDAYGPKLLELFATLLDARIESCKRVDKLVTQNTQRRKLILKQYCS